MNEEICRLDVSVDDVFLVYFFKTVADLLKNVDDFIFREFSSLAFNVLLEISLTVFEEKVQMLFGFGGFVKSEFKDEIT